MAPDLTVHDSASLGFDPTRLAYIDTFIEESYLQSGRFAGFSYLVSRGGKIAQLSTLGKMDAETGVAMAEDTLFRIFSMSKPVTSVALLRLYEQGKFRLDDPVSKFIPSWANLRVWADGNKTKYSTTFPEREMTVRDLLTHTAGLTYSWMGQHPVDALYRKAGLPGDNKLDTYVEILSELPLLFSPGSKWSYSVATDVIGRLVEVIGGQPFDAYLQREIFEPLAMVDTGFWVDDNRADRLGVNYAIPSLSPFPLPKEASGQSRIPIDSGGPESPFRSAPTFLSGGGGLVSTLPDYFRFARMLLNKGELDGARILGRKTVEYATLNHLPGGRDLAAMGQAAFSETTYDGIGFGLGFSVTLNPAESQVIGSAGEFAWGGAASTMFWIDPAEDLIVIGLAQLMPSSAYPIRQEMKALVYGAMT